MADKTNEQRLEIAKGRYNLFDLAGSVAFFSGLALVVAMNFVPIEYKKPLIDSTIGAGVITALTFGGLRYQYHKINNYRDSRPLIEQETNT